MADIESRQMYQSPKIFFILIPIGMLILFFIIDFGLRVYNEMAFKNVAKDVLRELVLGEDMSNLKVKAINSFQRRGYEADEVSVSVNGNQITLINYHRYFSMMGELKGGNKSVAVARYRGYLDENRDLVIEEIKEGEETPKIDPDEEVTIPAT